MFIERVSNIYSTSGMKAGLVVRLQNEWQLCSTAN